MIFNGDVVQKFERNAVGRDFVVGDIHGCLQDFISLKSAIHFNPQKDRMFSVGDLIDRGPDSLSTAALIYEPWFFAVRANHEQLLIDAVLNKHTASENTWMWNGGQWAADVDVQMLSMLAEDFNNNPYIITVGHGSDRVNIVHAEIIASTDADVDQWALHNKIVPEWHLNELVWGRSHIYNPSAVGRDLSITIVGHTPVQQPTYHELANHLYIDTGCVFGYRSANKDRDRFLTVADITNPADIQLISHSMVTKYTNQVPLAEVNRKLPI